MDGKQETTAPETKWRRVSASDLPLLAAHPAALAFGSESKAPEFSTEPLALGSAYGEAMAEAARVGREATNLVEIAMRHGVALLELQELWERFRWDPKGWMPEVQMELRRMASHGRYGIVISVRADLAAVIGDDEYEVVELKSERDVPRAYDAEEHAQLLAQMVAMFNQTGRPHGKGSIAYVRKGRKAWSSTELSGDEEHERVEDWLFGIAERALDQCDVAPEGRDCRVGAGCYPYCRGRSVCPFFHAESTTALALVQQKAEIVVTPESYPKLQALRKWAAAFVEATKKPLVDWLEAWGQPVPEPGTTKEWRVVEKHTTPAAGVTELRLALAARGWNEDAIEKLVLEVHAQRHRVDYKQAQLVAVKATPKMIEEEAAVREDSP